MNERLSETLINNRPACGIMPSLLTLAIGASALTAVADWAGWHFVWRHESTLGQETPRKHDATSIFMSYYLPFMPTLAILLGPAKLEVYNDGFAHAASFLLILLMAIVTGGVSASAWSMRRRHLEEEDARKLIDQQDPLPKHAFQHLVWTTTMLTICSIYWFYLLIF